jgi:hypothetical protein
VERLTESEDSIYRRRRHRRTALTLTVVALFMLGTFTYAAAYYQGWVGNRAAAPSPPASLSCQTVAPAQLLTPTAVTINVYNATDRSGLAASVAKSLRTQGFKVAIVANDPLGKSIGGVGEVRRGRRGAAGASLAAARLSGAKVVRDGRTDDTVDLVLGNKFTALSTPPEVAPPKASTPTPSC